MGKRKGKMWNRKRKAKELLEKSKHKIDDRDRKDSFKAKPINPTNAKMEAYYAYQGLHSYKKDGDSFVKCVTEKEMEEERQIFLKCMQTPLPASFRIGENLEPDLRKRLKEDVERLAGQEIEIEVDMDGNAINKRVREDGTKVDEEPKEKAMGDAGDDTTTATNGNTAAESNLTTKKVAPAKSIPYVPHGYQMSVCRNTIRRNVGLKAFHEWLKEQTEAGFVTRQETVSMIPPVVLSAEPHHAILDTCAAPGSKTSQLLEIVAHIPEGKLEPTGFVVANDNDAKRAYMLVHQLRRLNSPALFITSVDAQFWPMPLRGPNVTDEERAQEGMFDRVLCDVPCSGDGTARKNPGIWRTWNCLGGLALHPLQINIAVNGARLTKVGGYMCYSTCSMNPIENEAVVAQILRLTDGALELVDKRDEMKGFMARRGWTSWKVMTEKKRKKDVRNQMKKNNAKMQERRKQWEEKNKKAVDGDKKEEDVISEVEHKNSDTVDGKDKALASNGTENEENEEMEDVENCDEKDTKNADELIGNVWEPSPPSWNEEELLKRAQSRGLILYEKWQDVPAATRGRIRESCFPPTEEEIEKFQLHKCKRCLPHDLDTGGFFVALFKKVSPLSQRAKRKAEMFAAGCVSESEMNATSNTEQNSNQSADRKAFEEVVNKEQIPEKATDPPQEEKVEKFKGPKGFFGDDFVGVGNEVLPPLIEFYGLEDSFAHKQLMVRKSGDSKLLYFVTDSVKRNIIDRGVQDRVKTVNSGLRAFERGTRECEVRYRPVQESIHFVAPHMTKRKVILDTNDFIKCMAPGAIPCSEFSEQVAKEIREFSLGAFAVALRGFENNINKKLFLTMWRCKGDNVNCLVTKAELDGMRSKVESIDTNA